MSYVKVSALTFNKGVTRMTMKVNNAVPATLRVLVGAAIVHPDIGYVRSYQIAGELGAIRLGRRIFLVTEKLSQLIGRPITSADIARAEANIRKRGEREILRRAAGIKCRKKG
jgi:hypothetical protein